MRYEEAVKKHEPLTPYEKGLVAGIYRFAWQKDGVFCVGTTGSLLGDAIDRAITEYRESWPPRVTGPDAAAPLVVPVEEPAIAIAIESAETMIEESVADLLAIERGGRAKRPSYRGNDYDAAYAQGRKDACRVILIDLGVKESATTDKAREPS